MRDRILTISR